MGDRNLTDFATPSYLEFVYGVSTAYSESWRLMTWNDITPGGWMSTLQQANYSYLDIVYVFLCAVLWTLLRVFCSKAIFQKLVSLAGLVDQPAKSFPESLWKLSTSLFAWLVSAKLVLYKYKLFENPIRIVDSWDIDSQVPLDICYVYLGQISFYVHAIYATSFLDKWRKDSAVLLMHHFVTIFLIGGSYLFRYVHIGMLVLFLHDISDVLLEATKIFVYLKSKGGKWNFPCETASSVGFALFGCSWFLFRLYWFPLKVIYVTTRKARAYTVDFVPPFWFPLNSMLLLLLTLHIYWFKFIIEMTFKVLTGKAKEVEDVREYDEDASPNKTKSHKHASNGYATKKKR